MHDKIEGHLNNPSGSTVTMAVELRDKLHKRATDAEMKAEALRQELEAERAKTDDERLAAAVTLIDALKEIVDHSTANLKPEFIRDLPGEAYDTAAAYVGAVVGATQRDSERADVWRSFAKTIYEWRDKRKSRGWGEDAPPPVVARLPVDDALSEAAILNNITARKLAKAAKRLGYGLVKLVMPAKRGRPPGKRRATGRKGQGRRS